MKWLQAYTIAYCVCELLLPCCHRVQIAGSIRRQKPEVKDIEIVVIPKPYETGLFESGIATIVNQWQKVKGELPCKYTQRILPEGIKLDLFFAEPDNWGLIFAIRTGSAEFSRHVLAAGWTGRGYKSENGFLTANGRKVPVRTEIELFDLIGIPYVEPQER